MLIRVHEGNSLMVSDEQQDPQLTLGLSIMLEKWVQKS